MDLQPFCGKRTTSLLWAGSQGARKKKKITLSGIPNRLRFYLIFIVYNWFTDVTAGRIIQTGGPRVGTHALEYLSLWYFYCWARVNNWCVRVGYIQRVLLSHWDPKLWRSAGLLCDKATVLGEPVKGRPHVSRCKHFAPRPGRQAVGNTEPSYSAVICYERNEEACLISQGQ
jgi:hypothetical protein